MNVGTGTDVIISEKLERPIMNEDKLRWAAMYDAWASEQEAVSEEMLKDLGPVHEVERKLRDFQRL